MSKSRKNLGENHNKFKWCIISFKNDNEKKKIVVDTDIFLKNNKGKAEKVLFRHENDFRKNNFYWARCQNRCQRDHEHGQLEKIIIYHIAGMHFKRKYL